MSTSKGDFSVYVAQPQDQTVGSPSSPATWRAASASSLTKSNQAEAGCRPLRPYSPDSNSIISPSRDAGMPIDVNAAIDWRICVRSVRLPTTGPEAATSGGDGKNSRTMSDTCTTARHQSPATSPPNGGEEMSRYGCAPRAASWVSKASTSARYCVLPADHGVWIVEPKSSFSAISGVWQPVCLTAASNSLFAVSTTAAGSAGASGVPTRLPSLRSK